MNKNLIIFLLVFAFILSGCMAAQERSGPDDAALPAGKVMAKDLSSSLIYVTNEQSDDVSVINRFSGDVVDSVDVGSRPKGIAVSQAGERSRVYVANSGSDSVSVIDPNTNKVEYEIPIRLGTEPVDVAVAALSSGRRLIFVANYKSGSVSIVDADTYNEIEKVDAGSGPVALEADPPADVLSVNRFLGPDDVSQLSSYREKFLNVYVVNQHSNNISILRIDVLKGRCEDVTTLNVDWDPRSLFVDYFRGNVYVANYGSDKLSVINILRALSSGGQGAVTSINNAGNRITSVVSDTVFDRIYLLRDLPGEIIILKLLTDNDSGMAVMPPVLGRIAVGESPQAIIMGPEKRKLFVVNRKGNSISVIDKTTRKMERTVAAGERPYDIAVLSE